MRNRWLVVPVALLLAGWAGADVLLVDASGTAPAGWEVEGTFTNYDALEKTAAGITVAYSPCSHYNGLYTSGSNVVVTLDADTSVAPLIGSMLVGTYQYSTAGVIITNLKAGDYYLTAFASTGRSGGTHDLTATGDGATTNVAFQTTNVPEADTSNAATILGLLSDTHLVTVDAVGTLSLIGNGWDENLCGIKLENVPEPATMGLLGLGFAGLAVLRRRR